jgi:alcohol dehydrogenase-like protein
MLDHCASWTRGGAHNMRVVFPRHPRCGKRWPVNSPGAVSPAQPWLQMHRGCMITTRVTVAPMQVAQIPKPGAAFQIAECEMPTPGAGHVRLKVQACGVCHSDVLTKEGSWPGMHYPRVPGHEVADSIDALSAGVSAWQKEQRVGVGWHGGQDGTCRECRRGDVRNCGHVRIPGISYDGGYQHTWSLPWRHWRRYRRVSRTPKQPRCSAPA